MTEVIDATLATAGKSCNLGNDPSKYSEKFEDWYDHTSLLADSIGVKNEKQKLSLILLWGGRDFRKHCKDAGVITATEATEEAPVDDLNGAIEKIRKHFSDSVNLSMAMFKLMHVKQGTKSVIEFLTEIDELATQCQFVKNPYTKERAMKDAYIFGTSDDKLRKDALAKDLDFKTLKTTALGYEQSRNASGQITSVAEASVKQLSYSQAQVDEIVARVMAGKYSNRNPANSDRKPESNPNKCPNCPPHYRPHGQGRCPAKGKQCSACKEKDHFAKSRACKAGGGEPVRSVVEVEDTEYTFGRVEVLEIRQVGGSGENNVACMSINRSKVNMFVDSGSKKSLLLYEQYETAMGTLIPTTAKLRPYGTESYLNVKGKLHTMLKCEKGAQIKTEIIVIEGHLTEALLGDEDAKALGILKIDPEGAAEADIHDTVAGITDNLRKAGITVITQKNDPPEIPPDEKARIDKIVQSYPEVLKEDHEAGSGLLLDETLQKPDVVKFHIDHTVPPVAAQFKQVPVAYQSKVSQHLQELREGGKIEDVGPNEHCPWISNIVITEKKQADQIRMNLDAREVNKALKRTKQHIETVQEIRHKLTGATRFSELDLGHGYHQIALDEKSRQMSVFQTHEGLHRFKVLFFGASPASDLFHDRIKSAIKGVEGAISIHDNILVWGKTPKEHEENLVALLQRCKERGITVRLSKSNIGKTEVDWFGWTFSESGMSADKKKVRAIVEAGPPQSTEEVKSFLQACQFNARFMVESENAYAELTEPLRRLTRKNARFRWSRECEESYQNIIAAMTSDTALRPFDPRLKTKLVTDAAPNGIAASVFQEEETGVWIPVDHASRSLTPCEQNYSQIEKESLGQAWGMNEHRHYLLGIEFESYTDHQPLIPIYNANRRGNARIERHRLRVQGFQYTMKHLPGKSNPCDYPSRHPIPLESYTEKQKESMVIDDDDELCISKLVTDDLPDAVTLQMVQVGTREDATLQRLIKALEKGYLPNDNTLREYKMVFNELTYADQVLLRGDRLVIPDAELYPGSGSLRQLVVDNAHEGHQGIVKCKRLLRSKVWFPGMDAMMELKVNNCIACQATTYQPTRDPLKPSELPDGPWQYVDMDFWGPLPSGESILVMIDPYSRYPEVEFCHSTSAAAVVPKLDKVFSTHGFPEKSKSDGGPPFNGGDAHYFKQYMKWAGIDHTVVSPEDPEANGLAEGLMKSIKKVWHCARIEKKNFKQELYKFLRQYRATPHSTTGRSPAEILFKRTIRTRLPGRFVPEHDPELRAQNDQAKAKQKKYKDAKANVRPHNIQVGDKVLLLQKVTKTKSVYDPEPFEVIEVHGTQIKAERGRETKVRDAQKFKKVDRMAQRNYRRMREPLVVHTGEPDIIDSGEQLTQATHQAAQQGELIQNGGNNQPDAEFVHMPDAAEGDINIARRPRTKKRYNYPNGQLDPNIDVTLNRAERRRDGKKIYDAATGKWMRP